MKNLKPDEALRIGFYFVLTMFCFAANTLSVYVLEDSEGIKALLAGFLLAISSFGMMIFMLCFLLEFFEVFNKWKL